MINCLGSSTQSPVIPIYLRTNTGVTVKAHVDNSLMHKGATPCVFLFEDTAAADAQTSSHQSDASGSERLPIVPIERGVGGGGGGVHEKHNVLKVIKDVFLPQIEENELEAGNNHY